MTAKYILAAISMILFVSCNDGIPMVNLGIDNEYAVERMRPLILHPEFNGEKYIWTMPDSNGKDSVVSYERDLIFCSADTGNFFVKLRIIDPNNPYTHETRIVVWEEQVAYSRYITKVYEYCPAPGQFVNTMPPYETGDTYADMLRKAEESISGTNDIMVSLGAFGGYITFGFDHSVTNVPGQYDFKIYGNAFYAADKPNPDNPDSGGSSEPGIVMVSFDRNGNGIPDDTWYELAGSEYHKPETTHNHTITYHRPDRNRVPTPHPDISAIIDTAYIPFTDSNGMTGHIAKNVYHSQSYFPMWLSGQTQTITFSGTRLTGNAVDESGNGTYYVLYPYDFGYADNHPNEIDDKASFNIEWAVDSLGNPVHLPCIDFIRVYTAVSQSCGWLGETSTEISRAEDLHIPDKTQDRPNSTYHDIF